MISHSTIFLKDYCPTNFNINSIDLTFDILALDKVIVTNRMHVCRQLPGKLKLNGENLILKSIQLNDVALTENQYQLSESELVLDRCPDEFILQVVTELNPQTNTALSGLYASRDMLCTQCEAEGFRRITYCLDRPDVLSLFTTKIIADSQQFPNLLSNGNLIESGFNPQGRAYVVWQDPFLKPSYLFALVAGDLACVSDEFTTQSGRKVGLDIFVEHGDELLCDIAMRSVKRAMQWDEVRFGREYDLERYMIVAVKDFNMGAMENKGLNIFNAKYVLADEKIATDEDMLTIENIIGHEYFHNWTGNRVTCRDWFQLSLKEGLTIYRDHLFSQDMNHPVVQRIKEVSRLRKIQFPEDRGSMAHPVQPKSYQEIDNFYTATVYEKGGEIVRMYQVILGEQGFRRGMDLYFQRHDGQAVTIEDFFAAMQDANAVDLKHFKRWYDVSGTPQVQVKEKIEHGILSIELSQNFNPPLYIPIRFAVYSKRLGQLKLPELLILEKTQQVFQFPVYDEELVVSYLQGFSAPIILHKSYTEDEINLLIKYEKDGFTLWDLKQTCFIATIQAAYHSIDGKLSVSEDLLQGMRSWINAENTDYALLAELFKVPSFEECLPGLKDVDPPKLEKIRKQFEKTLAHLLHTEFKSVYEQLSHHKQNETAGHRAFRLLSLNYLLLVDDKNYLKEVYDLYQHSQNMTEITETLKSIMEIDNPNYQNQVLKDFNQKWQHQEIVMDKWFLIQSLYQSLAELKPLVNHPSFSWENPNKVRSLVGGFTNNPIHFHAEDGSGYAFLKDCVLKLDKINPQVAARVVVPFTRWDWLDASRQSQVFSCLKQLLKHDLSSNVYEMVSQSLPKH